MRTPALLLPESPLLSSLENLGSIDNDAFYLIKPFRDWQDKLWKHKIFHFRLCNVGEGLNILEEVSKVGDDAKAQLMKIHIIAHSIFMINGNYPILPQELTKFNEKNKLDWSQVEYTIEWLKNIEQIVLDRLDVVYAALQQKQMRQLRGEIICDGCGNIFKEYPENAKKLKYSVSEIICNACLGVVNMDDYDFIEEKEEKVKEEVIEIPPTNYKCPHCETEMNTFEEYSNHISECKKLSV